MDPFVAMFLRFFFVLTPFAILATFLAWTDALDEVRRRRLALRVTAAVLVGSFFLLVCGNWIFNLFGITLDAFRVGAGALLFLSALNMVRGDVSAAARHMDGDIAVVPLAIPMTLGPATIGMLLVMSAERLEAYRAGTVVWGELLAEGLGIFAAVLAVGAMLYLSSYIERLLGQRGLTIMSKLTGLILAAIAAQMIMHGARQLLFA